MENLIKSLPTIHKKHLLEWGNREKFCIWEENMINTAYSLRQVIQGPITEIQTKMVLKEMHQE